VRLAGFWARVACLLGRSDAGETTGAVWGRGEVVFPCLPRDGVHGRDGKEESCWVS
jgi:hypothetical protein